MDLAFCGQVFCSDVAGNEAKQPADDAEDEGGPRAHFKIESVSRNGHRVNPTQKHMVIRTEDGVETKCRVEGVDPDGRRIRISVPQAQADAVALAAAAKGSVAAPVAETTGMAPANVDVFGSANMKPLRVKRPELFQERARVCPLAEVVKEAVDIQDCGGHAAFTEAQLDVLQTVFWGASVPLEMILNTRNSLVPGDFHSVKRIMKSMLTEDAILVDRQGVHDFIDKMGTFYTRVVPKDACQDARSDGDDSERVYWFHQDDAETLPGIIHWLSIETGPQRGEIYLFDKDELSTLFKAIPGGAFKIGAPPLAVTGYGHDAVLSLAEIVTYQPWHEHFNRVVHQCDGLVYQTAEYFASEIENNAHYVKTTWPTGHKRSQEIDWSNADGNTVMMEYSPDHPQHGSQCYLNDDGAVYKVAFVHPHTRKGETRHLGPDGGWMRVEFGEAHPKHGERSYNDGGGMEHLEFAEWHTRHGEVCFYEDSGQVHTETRYRKGHPKHGEVNTFTNDTMVTSYEEWHRHHGCIKTFEGLLEDDSRVLTSVVYRETFKGAEAGEIHHIFDDLWQSVTTAKYLRGHPFYGQIRSATATGVARADAAERPETVEFEVDHACYGEIVSIEHSQKGAALDKPTMVTYAPEHKDYGKVNVLNADESARYRSLIFSKRAEVKTKTNTPSGHVKPEQPELSVEELDALAMNKNVWLRYQYYENLSARMHVSLVVHGMKRGFVDAFVLAYTLQTEDLWDELGIDVDDGQRPTLAYPRPVECKRRQVEYIANALLFNQLLARLAEHEEAKARKSAAKLALKNKALAAQAEAAARDAETKLLREKHDREYEAKRKAEAEEEKARMEARRAEIAKQEREDQVADKNAKATQNAISRVDRAQAKLDEVIEKMKASKLNTAAGKARTAGKGKQKAQTPATQTRSLEEQRQHDVWVDPKEKKAKQDLFNAKQVLDAARKVESEHKERMKRNKDALIWREKRAVEAEYRPPAAAAVGAVLAEATARATPLGQAVAKL